MGMMNRWAMAAGLAFLAWAAAAQAEVRREIQFPDVPGYQTLKCDFHMHTVFSDGKVWPTVRVDEAWREGLDAIAITDHIEYQPHKAYVAADFNAPYELAQTRAKEKNILLIKGVEITRDTPPGHFNAIFVGDAKAYNKKDFYEVFRAAAAQKAYVFWCHPDWKGVERGRWGEAQSRLLESHCLHAIEICNGDGYQAQAHRIAVEKNLPFVGNSDIHEPSDESAPTPANHRTLTLVFARSRTVGGVREALDAGRTVVWWKNQLIGREPLLAPLFAACVRIGPVHHRSKDAGWIEIRNTCELDIELERADQGSPPRITVPARGTALVKLDTTTWGEGHPVPCRVRNFLIGPDQPLLVNLPIAEPVTTRAASPPASP